MNEQIQQLADQASLYASRQTTDLDEWEFIFRKKFAELIVRECAQVCRDQPNHYALKADRDNCAIAIEEHFGVEE